MVKESVLCEVLAGKRDPEFATSVGTAPETHPFFEGEVIRFEPADEANLRVFLRLTNSGENPAKASAPSLRMTPPTASSDSTSLRPETRSSPKAFLSSEVLFGSKTKEHSAS